MKHVIPSLNPLVLNDVIYFILKDETYIYDIESITILANGTLIMFETLKSGGIVYQIVRIEDIEKLFYTDDRSTLPDYDS